MSRHPRCQRVPRLGLGPGVEDRAVDDEAEPGPGPQHLAIAEPDGLLPQTVPIGRVRLGRDPLPPGGQGEGFRHAVILSPPHAPRARRGDAGAGRVATRIPPALAAR